LGTNDSHGLLPVPSGCGLKKDDPGYAGSFKDSMQLIISTLKENGVMPFLGKVPITFGPCSTCPPFSEPSSAARNVLIRDYNTVIFGGVWEANGSLESGLLSMNELPFVPPDFYSYYEAHPEEFFDNLHPNGVGY
jgi:hypothetical protein